MANLTFGLLNKKKHDRATFDCHDIALNVFLQKQANQDIGTHKSRTFVCVDTIDESQILGYYTLVYEHIDLALLPANYYALFGFIAAPDDPLTLFLPVTTIAAAF